MKNLFNVRLLLALAALTLSASLHAAIYTKADNTNSLDQAISWGGTAPGSGDIAQWSGAYSAGPATGVITNSLYAIFPISTNLSWGGISVGALTGTALNLSPIFNVTTSVSNIIAATEGVTNGFNIVTITCNAGHRFENGESVTISGITPAGYNGTYIIAGVPSSSQFTCTNATGGLAAATPSGLATAVAAANMYIGGSSTGNEGLTIGSSGITVAGGAPGVVINTASNAFSGNQTWHLASGTLVRFADNGGAASGEAVSSGADGLIEISGGGIASLNPGGASGFTDAGGFTGFGGNWQVDSGTTLRSIRNGSTAFGSGSITLNGGTLAVGGMSGDVGNWTWNTTINLNSGTTSYLSEQNVTGTGRSLLLSGAINGSGNVVFTEALVGGTSFTSQDLGFILSGSDSMSGTVTIGGPIENGVPGRLTYVRIGGNATGTATTLGSGAYGSLGNATSIIDNGVLSFTLTTGYLMPCPISGTGTLRIGSLNSAAGTGGYIGDAYQDVTLVGANTYSGATIINAGTLSLAAGATLARSSSIIIATNSINGGAVINTFDTSQLASGFTTASGQTLSLNGGQVNGSLNCALGSTNIFAPGGSNVVGTLMISGDLTLSGGSNTMVLDINNSANDQVSVSGDLTASGVTTLQFVPVGLGVSAGTYTLITASGTVTATPANFSISGLSSGGRSQTFNIAINGNSVQLVVVGNPGLLTWVGDGINNLWNVETTSNWFNTTTSDKDVFYQGDQVTFDDTGSASPAVNLVTVVAPGAVTNNSVNNQYVFSGSGHIAGAGSLTMNGPGIWTIDTSNSFWGGVVLNAGWLAITNEAALGEPTNGVADSLTFNGGALLITNTMTLGINTNRGILIQSGGGGFVVTNGSTLTVSDVIGDATGSGVLTKTGNGTLILDGLNNYGGGTVIDGGGAVICGSPNALGHNGTSANGNFCPGFTLLSGSVDINGQGNYFSAGNSVSNNFLFDNVYLTFGGESGATTELKDSAVTAVNAGFGLATPGPSAVVITYNGANYNGSSPGKALISAPWYAVGTGATERTNQISVDTSSGTPVGLEFRGQLSSLGYEGKVATIQKIGPGVMEISSTNYFPQVEVTAGTLLVNNNYALGQDRSPNYNGVGTGLPHTLLVDGGTVDLDGFNPAIGALSDNGGVTSGMIVNNGATASVLTLGYSASNTVNNASYAGVIADGTMPVSIATIGTNTQTLAGINTYSGVTTVNNGALVINGQIGLGAATNLVTVTGGALGGAGAINAPVTVQAGGTLAPAVGASQTTTLTINASLTLAGTTLMNVDEDTATNDLVVLTSGTVNYGGVLTISTGLMSATTLALGNSFQLFSVPAHTGNFSSIAGSPGTGLGWSFNPANGVVTVVNVASNPTNILFSVSGSTMTLSWPADHLGWILQSQTNTLNSGLGTNWLDISGTAGVTTTNLPIVPANPTVFYRLRHP